MASHVLIYQIPSVFHPQHGVSLSVSNVSTMSASCSRLNLYLDVSVAMVTKLHTPEYVNGRYGEKKSIWSMLTRKFYQSMSGWDELESGIIDKKKSHLQWNV